MTALDPPDLDDRRFQHLVDDAKRFIRERCPEWTDHNVSDPGVTLIEAFAWMVEVLLFRLNQVPERQYRKFLELVGVTLRPPVAARTLVSFRLATHLEDGLLIPRGTAVSTRRTLTDEVIEFRTVQDATVTGAVGARVVCIAADGAARDITGSLGTAYPIDCFTDHPAIGDAFYVELDRPAPANIVLLQLQCAEARGHGIDARHPPLSWQAWDGHRWADCAVEVDGTRGLNLSGPVELHLPPSHDVVDVAGVRSWWIRCLVVDPGAHEQYRSSPQLRSVSAASVGVDVVAQHARRVYDEWLGDSTGLPGQRFVLDHTPVLDDGTTALEVDGVGWERVGSFGDSGATDPHFVLDPTSGTVTLGPGVRGPDGDVQYGAVPPQGAAVRMAAYTCGGGADGNVAEREISVLRTSIPSVSSVYNRAAAAGGYDGETVDQARVRGPLELHARNRAVTLEDYAFLARRAAADIAQVSATVDGAVVRIGIVPAATQVDGRIALRNLLPDDDLVAQVGAFLDERRSVGATVVVSGAAYRGLDVVVAVTAQPGTRRETVQDAVLAALYRYVNPVSGGPDGTGWPFGLRVSAVDIAGRLAAVPGVATVDVPAIYTKTATRERNGPHTVVELRTGETVYSDTHEVTVR